MNRIARRSGWGFAFALCMLAAVASLTVLGSAVFGDGPRGPAGRAVLAPELVTWANFTPTTWVTTLPATANVTVTSPATLDLATAAYATSADGGVNWTAWGRENLSISGAGGGQNFTVSGLAFPDSGTQNRIQYRVAEVGGQLEYSPIYTVKVDATAPTAPLSLTATPAAWTNINSFSFSWTNPADAIGIAGAWYKWDAPPTSATDGVYSPTPSGITGATAPSDGQHTVYVWLRDAAGRADPLASATTTVRLDRVAPPPPYALHAQPAYTWTNVNSFSESWTNPPDPSGIVAAFYQWNSVPGSPGSTPVRVETTDSIANIPAPGNGKHDLYLWLVDGAGNSSTANWIGHPQVFWYDAALPTSSVALSSLPAASGWYTASVTATFSGEDQPNLSGLQAVFWQLDDAAPQTTGSVEISAEGAHQLIYYAIDNAGNQETARRQAVNLDRTEPIPSLTPSSLPQPSGWYTTGVALTLEVVDAVSGPAGGYYRINGGAWQTTSPFTLDEDGIYQIEYYGLDVAGNRSGLFATQVKMDAQTPTTAHQIEGTAGLNGWFTSPVTVKLTATDGGSGVSETWYRIGAGEWQAGTQFSLAVDGVYSLEFYSVDASGNREASHVIQVKLDTTAPAAPTALETVPADWSRTNSFTVTWTHGADLSGLAGAYYRFDAAPAHPADGTWVASVDRLDGLAVPAEGEHPLYVWLRDVAGNASIANLAEAPRLRYDPAPPAVEVVQDGLAGDNGWRRSATSVTLTASDAASGVRVLNYRVGASGWLTATQSVRLDFAEAGEYSIEYSAEDLAGNVSAVKVENVRLDMTAPPAAPGLVASPAGWQSANSFAVAWQPVEDLSGVGGALVKVGQPPTGPADGVFYPGASGAGGITVPGEGKHSLWVWLRDAAGNADHLTATLLNEAAWYDATPPATNVTRAGTLGLYGWYRSPVTFRLNAVDAASGVAEVLVRVDEGAWAPVTGDYVHTLQGEHTVRVRASDRAGNVEAEQSFVTKVDTVLPRAWLTVPAPQEVTSYSISWGGEDTLPGAGLLYYDVFRKEGYTGQWWSLALGTSDTSMALTGERGHTYFFRVVAVDGAGNRQQPPATGRVTITPVLNGRFDTGLFTDWTTSGKLYKAVVPEPGPDGTETKVARLGTDAYDPSLEDPGSVPVDHATMSQQVWIPDAAQLQDVCLTFAYEVFSYDVMYSQRLGRYVDTLDVTLTAEGGAETLLLRAGNPTGVYGKLWDSGWRHARFDLAPWAGQTVTLSFANFNRNDNLFNTWSYVDDIQVTECRPTHLPLLAAPARAPGAAPEPSSDPDAAPAGRR